MYAYKGADGGINAILVPKIETNEAIDCTPQLIRGRILKLCLLKVADHMRGLKLGERLLRMGIDYADENNLEEMYLTLYRQDNDALIYSLEAFTRSLFYKAWPLEI